MKTLESVQKHLAKIHTPESALAQLEYLEYLEFRGERVCQIEKISSRKPCAEL